MKTPASTVLGSALLLVTLLACGDGTDGSHPSTPEPTSISEPSPESTPSTAAPSAPPDAFLLLTLDTTRADRLAPWGGELEVPTLGALARGGVVFENAYAVAPVTLPTHATLFTGLYPPQHGIRNNGIHYLDDRWTTLAELFQARGAKTAAFVSAAVLERRYGLDQGFDVYDDDLSGGGPRQSRLNAERPAAVTVDAARQWLDTLEGSEPFFLWVHLFDPHAPYDPPAPWKERFGNRPYEGEIAAMDAAIGELLKHPRLDLDRTLVMAIADHGESLGEHGEETHAMLAYDATLHIPWIVHHPSAARGSRVDAAVSQVDLLPTVVDLLGFDMPPGLAGSSLAGQILGSPGQDTATAPDRPLYAETLVPFYTYGWAKLHTVRRQGQKFIDAPNPELYDLTQDPGELENLYAPGAAEDLRRDLETFVSEGGGDEESTLPRDREVEAKLRSLGYLSANAPPRSRQRLDPKEVIDLHLELERGQHAFFQRRMEDAENAFRRVLRRDSENLTALAFLAKSLTAQQRFDDALRLASRALELDPENPDLLVVLGLIESSRGEEEKALTAFETALELDPRWLDAAIERVRSLERLGRRDAAVAALGEILEQDPQHLRSRVAEVELVTVPAGDFEAAESTLSSITEQDPTLAEAWRALGEVFEATRRFDAAVDVYRRGLEYHPGEGILHARLGINLVRLGHLDGATQHLEAALRSGQDTASVHYALASLASRRGAWAEVETRSRRALELDPSLSGAWNLLAASLEEQGRFDQALSAYGAALEQDPENWQAEYNRGLLLVRGQRYGLASESFGRVLGIRPDHGGSHFQLGILFGGPLGNRQRAIQHFQASLEAEPNHPRVTDIRRLLRQLGE